MTTQEETEAPFAEEHLKELLAKLRHEQIMNGRKIDHLHEQQKTVAEKIKSLNRTLLRIREPELVDIRVEPTRNAEEPPDMFTVEMDDLPSDWILTDEDSKKIIDAAVRAGIKRGFYTISRGPRVWRDEDGELRRISIFYVKSSPNVTTSTFLGRIPPGLVN